ncbi:MAG: hypothetical protein HY900_35815 [Deltaproteobacteria bacterium]|nr:hypothetical protein [Deltaproteobacteria bacterium]
MRSYRVDEALPARSSSEKTLVRLSCLAEDGFVPVHPEHRIRRSFEVHATRFEPVGLAYLWPVSG